VQSSLSCSSARTPVPLESTQWSDNPTFKDNLKTSLSPSMGLNSMDLKSMELKVLSNRDLLEPNRITLRSVVLLNKYKICRVWLDHWDQTKLAKRSAILLQAFNPNLLLHPELKFKIQLMMSKMQSNPLSNKSNKLLKAFCKEACLLIKPPNYSNK
jgi:hypothetical protein